MIESTHSDADTAAILELWKRYESTWDSGDIDLWMPLWTEDGVQLPPHAPANVGKDQIRENMGAVQDQWTFVTAVTLVEVGGSGDWAYCWGRYTQTSTPKSGG